MTPGFRSILLFFSFKIFLKFTIEFSSGNEVIEVQIPVEILGLDYNMMQANLNALFFIANMGNDCKHVSIAI